MPNDVVFNESGTRTPLHVIGYPKSGSTWITRLVGDVLDSPTGSGYGSDVEDIAREGSGRRGPFIVLKSHYSLLDRPATIGMDTPILYVVRDPRDVLVSSFFHHYRIDEDLVLLREHCTRFRLQRLFWRGIVFSVETRKLTQSWGALFGGSSIIGVCKRSLVGTWRKTKSSTVGSWSEHVDYWRALSGRVGIVTYEALRRDAEHELGGIFSFLCIPFHKSRLIEAIERQAFQNKKAAFIRSGDKRNAQFMRKGQSGDWARFLSDSQLARVKRLHGKTMDEMGYY